MKINEFTKYDLVVIDFMSGDDQVNGLDLATQDDIEVLQTGTGSIPTIFNIERDSLQGAIFVSHLRHSGVNFDDVSGEGHVAPGMQGKSAMMRDAAEEQGFDVTELPFTTDLEEETDDGVIYKVFVNTHGDPEDSWATNGIKYNTAEEAAEAAKDLFMRWTAVKYWRVMDSEQQTVYAEGP